MRVARARSSASSPPRRARPSRSTGAPEPLARGRAHASVVHRRRSRPTLREPIVFVTPYLCDLTSASARALSPSSSRALERSDSRATSTSASSVQEVPRASSERASATRCAWAFLCSSSSRSASRPPTSRALVRLAKSFAVLSRAARPSAAVALAHSASRESAGPFELRVEHGTLSAQARSSRGVHACTRLFHAAREPSISRRTKSAERAHRTAPPRAPAPANRLLLIPSRCLDDGHPTRRAWANVAASGGKSRYLTARTTSDYLFDEGVACARMATDEDRTNTQMRRRALDGDSPAY